MTSKEIKVGVNTTVLTWIEHLSPATAGDAPPSYSAKG
jgi:hypothetical protein